MSKSITAAIILSILFLGACKSKKLASGSSFQPQEIEVLWSKIDKRLEFETFSSKMKLRFSDSTGSQSASAQIRIAKDSLIWISLRKASIEGARVLISPDSVKILDRQAKRYFPASYSYFEERFGLKFSFQELQDIIIGDALLRDDDGSIERDFKSIERESKMRDLWGYDRSMYMGAQDGAFSWELDTTENHGDPDGKTMFSYGTDNGIYSLMGVRDSLVYTFWMDVTSTVVTKMNVQEQESARLLSIDLANYTVLGSHNFAQERTVYLTDGEGLETTLEIDFSGMELNEELNFSFSVNDRYELIKAP